MHASSAGGGGPLIPSLMRCKHTMHCSQVNLQAQAQSPQQRLPL
jgi:hypothetical protein